LKREIEKITRIAIKDLILYNDYHLEFSEVLCNYTQDSTTTYLEVSSKSTFETLRNQRGNQMITSVIVKTLTKEERIDVAYSNIFRVSDIKTYMQIEYGVKTRHQVLLLDGKQVNEEMLFIFYQTHIQLLIHLF